LRGITAPAYAGFQANCLGTLPSSSFAAPNAAQIAQWPATSVTKITNVQMNKVTPVGGAGFTADQVANFDGTFGGGCSGMQLEVVVLEVFFCSFIFLFMVILFFSAF
jgi:hypothetical protein